MAQSNGENRNRPHRDRIPSAQILPGALPWGSFSFSPARFTTCEKWRNKCPPVGARQPLPSTRVLTSEDGPGQTVPRLRLDQLDRAPVEWRPVPDPRTLSVGIVHLGTGAFHRAHQAVYTQQAMAVSGETSWGICGVTQRSPAVAEALLPQDCLYSVLERSAEGTKSVLLAPSGTFSLRKSNRRR